MYQLATTNRMYNGITGTLVQLFTRVHRLKQLYPGVQFDIMYVCDPQWVRLVYSCDGHHKRTPNRYRRIL